MERPRRFEGDFYKPNVIRYFQGRYPTVETACRNRQIQSCFWIAVLVFEFQDWSWGIQRSSRQVQRCCLDSSTGIATAVLLFELQCWSRRIQRCFLNSCVAVVRSSVAVLDSSAGIATAVLVFELQCWSRHMQRCFLNSSVAVARSSVAVWIPALELRQQYCCLNYSAGVATSNVVF